MNLRPWALWLVNHRCKFVLFVLLIASTPIYLAVYALPACGEALRAMRDEFMELIWMGRAQP